MKIFYSLLATLLFSITMVAAENTPSPVKETERQLVDDAWMMNIFMECNKKTYLNERAVFEKSQDKLISRYQEIEKESRQKSFGSPQENAIMAKGKSKLSAYKKQLTSALNEAASLLPEGSLLKRVVKASATPLTDKQIECKDKIDFIELGWVSSGNPSLDKAFQRVSIENKALKALYTDYFLESARQSGLTKEKQDEFTKSMIGLHIRKYMDFIALAAGNKELIDQISAAYLGSQIETINSINFEYLKELVKSQSPATESAAESKIALAIQKYETNVNSIVDYMKWELMKGNLPKKE